MTTPAARTARGFAARLRALRSALASFGLAALLAAMPCALVVPQHAASAAPATAQSPSGSTQEPNDPKTKTTDNDPDDAPWPGDEDDDNPPTLPGNQGVQPGGPDQNVTPPDSTDTKGVVATPDSTLNAKSSLPQAGGGALDTLDFKPAGVGARRPSLAASDKRIERRPIFGLHPAVFFLGILVGHMLIVKAIDH